VKIDEERTRTRDSSLGGKRQGGPVGRHSARKYIYVVSTAVVPMVLGMHLERRFSLALPSTSHHLPTHCFFTILARTDSASVKNMRPCSSAILLRLRLQSGISWIVPNIKLVPLPTLSSMNHNLNAHAKAPKRGPRSHKGWSFVAFLAPVYRLDEGGHFDLCNGHVQGTNRESKSRVVACMHAFSALPFFSHPIPSSHHIPSPQNIASCTVASSRSHLPPSSQQIWRALDIPSTMKVVSSIRKA